MAPNSSRERVFRALHDIAVAIGGVLEPVALGHLVVHQARELLDASAVGLYLFDDSSQLLEAAYSSDARATTPEPTIPLGEGAAGRALLLGEPVVVDDYANWPHAGSWAAANGVRSAMAVPLMVADRRTGAISVRSYAPRHWSDDDVQTLTLLAAQIAPVLEAAQLYEHMREARQQAEDAIKLRDEVLTGVSHDLAGPLARIRLYAELIQGEVPNLQASASAEQMNLWSERIVVATLTMKSIMQELGDVARLQMGHALQLDLRRTDLVGLSRRMVSELQAAGRLVSVGSSCDEIVGWWDESRLTRLLGNLLDNAFNYSLGGTGVDVLVDAVHGDRSEWAVLLVRDYGLGIPPEDLPHIFERFYRGSNVGENTTGSGLGLAVAHQIVEQHGGSIEVDSRLGEGTVISVRLPRTTSPGALPIQ